MTGRVPDRTCTVGPAALLACHESSQRLSIFSRRLLVLVLPTRQLGLGDGLGVGSTELWGHDAGEQGW